jgi:hypothetical protein
VVLNLGLDDVAASDLAETLTLLAGVEKPPGLLRRQLGRGVPPFGGNQRVVALGHGDGEPALRDVDPCLCQRLGGLGPPVGRFRQGLRGNLSAQDGP